MSTSPDREFIDTFVADIDDDLPRLVYADWLDENGRPDRAEFVRVQVERARLPSWDPAQVRLRVREAELIRLHGEEWLAEMPAVEGARWEGFRRGVVAEVSFASFEAMRKNAHACRAVAPVEAVTVRWPRRREGQKRVKPIAELRELTLTGTPEYEAFGWVADSPQLATLRQLTIQWVFSSLPDLLASPHLGNLRSLRLPQNHLGSYMTEIEVIADAPGLDHLEELDIPSVSRHERYVYDAEVRWETIRRLMSWDGMATVRSLNLSGHDLAADTLRELFRAPHIAGLKHLGLRDARLDGEAVAEFATARSDLRLESLDVGQNVLKDVGAESIALAPCLRDLKVLRIDRCEISRAGGKRFAEQAAFLDNLRILDVGHNHFGADGLAALLGRSPSHLHTLAIPDNDLFDTGVVKLAASPASDTLAELDLSRNVLSDSVVRILRASPHLRDLLVLRLEGNRLGETAVAALAASPLGRRLAVLDPGDGPI